MLIMATNKTYQKVDKTIYYNSIPVELKRLGLTQEKTAELLGISRSGLNHRLKADSPTLHWAVYGLSCFFGNDDNLGERAL